MRYGGYGALEFNDYIVTHVPNTCYHIFGSVVVFAPFITPEVASRYQLRVQIAGYWPIFNGNFIDISSSSMVTS